MMIVKRLDDGPRYKNRFDVVSERSLRQYRISYDAAGGAGYWTCSCMAGVRGLPCRHLRHFGLRGRGLGQGKIQPTLF